MLPGLRRAAGSWDSLLGPWAYGFRLPGTPPGAVKLRAELRMIGVRLRVHAAAASRRPGARE
jgi:hypothetical protein